MIAEIISIGTELLLGQITDTNRPYIAKQLSAIGLDSYHQSIVGDNYQRMYAEMETANHRADLVILIGGLGPTEDDLTKTVAADVLNESLIADDAAMDKVVNWHQNTNVPMTETNRLQALYLHGGQAIKNDVGFAVGSYYQNEQGADFLLLPGPPWELEQMVDKYVVPLLKEKYLANTVMRSLVLRYYGIGESRLETELRPLIDQQTNPTLATYAKKHEVTVRLTAQAETAAQADALNQALAEKVNALVGDYLYGYDDDNSLAAMTNQALHDQQQTLQVIEGYTDNHMQNILEPLNKTITFQTTSVTGAKAAETLVNQQQVESNNDIVIAIVPDTNQAQQPTDTTNYQNELVWFSIKHKQAPAQTFSRTLARSHANNIESACFIALDTIRRTALNLPLLKRR